MTAVERVRAAFARNAAVDRPELWISLRPLEAALAEAAEIDARAAQDQPLPLAGTVLAVKDNVDVAGLPTTAGCPSYAYTPELDAPAVARLREAGAVVIGKTNLDQFATGLVGTRSPHGPVRDARRPEYISGGSSSGSAVAVALGIADIAIGTDTAGSGRVPAAFQGLVGVKPTFGLVPTRGSVPACRTLDCLTIFAVELDLAQLAIWTMAGADPDDPTSRGWPQDAPLAARARPVIAIPHADWLVDLTPAALEAFAAMARRVLAGGCELREIDPSPLLEAGRLLYQGAFVAERYAAVGRFVESHPDAVDPTVGAIITAAGKLQASDLAADQERLDGLRLQVERRLDGCDALLMPTTTEQPTIAAVNADPVAANSRLGLYTNFCNLLGMSALAIPAGVADGGNFGVTLFGRHFHDLAIADIARRVLELPRRGGGFGPVGFELLVVGAHRDGQPLNHQLTERCARLRATVRTAPNYRLFALDTTPAKPGLVRVAEEGVAIEGEVWELPRAELGSFLAELPAPMTLGQVELEDGRRIVGFGCDQIATVGARDISEFGGWLAYLASTRRAVGP